jgi:4-hydroxybenzoate polyprenyltransferase
MRALALGLAMLGFQASIGAVNDIVDAPDDAHAKPWKPIPAGSVSVRTASVLAVATGGLGLAISAAAGPLALAVGAAGYACGLAYDLVLRRVGLGWLGYAIAFPLLLVYPWVAVTGTLPPRAGLLLPVAALAGPALYLANGLVDLDEDRQREAPGLVVRLGQTRAVRLLAALILAVYGLAWLTVILDGAPGVVSTLALVLATGLALGGTIASASPISSRRQLGWSAQAAAVALLGVSWVAGVVGAW